MSDNLTVGFIGVAGTVVGTLVGGVISWMLAREQNRAQIVNLERQLVFQAQEARVARLVEARKSYLVLLREKVSGFLQASLTLSALTARMKEASNREKQGVPGADRDLLEEMREWKAAADSSITARVEMNVLRGQIGDRRLLALIDETQKTSDAVSGEYLHLVSIVNQKGRDFDEMQMAYSRLLDIQKAVAASLLPVNQRIEELLSGDPTS